MALLSEDQNLMGHFLRALVIILLEWIEAISCFPKQLSNWWQETEVGKEKGQFWWNFMILRFSSRASFHLTNTDDDNVLCWQREILPRSLVLPVIYKEWNYNLSLIGAACLKYSLCFTSLWLALSGYHTEIL